MSALQWLSEFLEKRDIKDGKPDGRPLYAYQCTVDEYASLKELLVSSEKNITGTDFHLGYALSTGYLFAFYCSEWWRRNYEGGVWKWDPIITSLGWDHNTWNKRTEFVAKGLRYWKRDLIHTGAGTQYLLSVASEGGIPINVLERENASFKYFLKAVIREYGFYVSGGLTAERVAYDNLNKLPLSWQQDQIATLAGQIVEQLWLLKSEIGDSTEPVKTLNEVHPDWSKTLPIALESEQAETLVNSLLNTARSVASGESQMFRLERNLDKTVDGWVLSAKLLLPKELNIKQIETMGALTSIQAIPERLEMYRVIGDERVLVARLSGEGDARFIRLIPGATQSYIENSYQELSLILVAKGQDIASLSVAGGEELDPLLPWCFVDINSDMQHFRWIGQGGSQRREPSVFVLFDQAPISLSSDSSAGFDEIEGNVLGRKLWWVSAPTEFHSDQEDEIYRIEPGLMGIANRDYRMIGYRNYFPNTRFPLYRTVPRIQLVNDDSVATVVCDELVWRPIGKRQWRSYSKSQMIGDLEIRHRKDKVAFASWKLSILPENAQIHVEPISRFEGIVSIASPNSKVAVIHSMNDLEVSNEQSDESWKFLCKRSDVSTGSVSGEISWENDCSLSFSLPYPAEGATFVDGDGKDAASSDLLTLSRLYGFRAQVVTLSRGERYLLRGFLLTTDRPLPAIHHHQFEYPMSVDEYGVSTLPLQQLKSEIELLFAVSTGVDDQVKLEIIKSSSPCAESTVLIQQFDGVLYVDQIRKFIHLAVNNNDHKHEYIGQALNLISINSADDDVLTLEWNNISEGWILPDYNDENIDLSNTYFANVDGDNSYNYRPCVIPPEVSENTDSISNLVRAMAYADVNVRQEGISNHFLYLLKEGSEDDWRELCAYLKRFSCIHPDGLDLVECMLDFPEIMAAVWFRSVPDLKLREYLKKICNTSPFAWWMISIDQWVSAAKCWLQGHENLPESVKDILIDGCINELKDLSRDNEEMNCIVDVLIELFGKNLLERSTISSVRTMAPEKVWKYLDQMSRGLYIPGYDGHWPKIEEVFKLRNQLSKKIYNYIRWPIDDMSFSKKSVIQGAVITAAFLHENLKMNENQRIALLAARNFHPVAFATLFRATQAILWINRKEITNE